MTEALSRLTLILLLGYCYTNKVEVRVELYQAEKNVVKKLMLFKQQMQRIICKIEIASIFVS